MIADNQTNIIYFSEQLRTDSRFTNTFNQITQYLDFHSIQYKLLPKTNDIWARDYMPIQVSENKFIEFRYDPDYLQGTKRERRELKSYPDIICDAINLKTIKSDIILDGGNVVKSENCVILTDKIVIENRYGYNKSQITHQLSELFEVEKVILIPWTKAEDYGHTDGMFRFIDEETILINSSEKTLPLEKQFKQSGIKWEYLDFKVRKPNTKINWAYINFLQTKDLILLPKFNIEEDEQAFSEIGKYYPDYLCNNRIIQIDANDIVKYGGALNCISWTIKS